MRLPFRQFARSAGAGLMAASLLTVTVQAQNVDYVRDIRPLLKVKCCACHGPLKQESDLRLDTGGGALRGGASGPALTPGDASASELIRRVSSSDPDERMPPAGEPLTPAQVDRLRRWIDAGAPAPADERPQVDPREHWAFQPIPANPSALTIDAFIAQRLEEVGIAPNPQADRRTLIRRLFLDMHGLPPAPAQVAAFVDDQNPEAWERLIDVVLASPRYGEHWAQHWLDIVRYADTHGFEVNTPRENAWPYRDYVIGAFNGDLPYDEFLRQQIAGDASGVDVATGFLVAAPVLLPGQIGKDDASKRLARQDELDEMIVGTSATFLGLTIGCARCHDHKFDPISQRDYYALQAFFTGVEYGDRPIHDADSARRQERAAALTPRIEVLQAALKKFEPASTRGRTLLIDDEDASGTSVLRPPQGHAANPEGTQRGYRDDPGSATRSANLSGGRYSWWTNQSGEDVLAYTPRVSGEFEIWLSWGTNGSGAQTHDARYLLDTDGDLSTIGDQQQIARIDQSAPAGMTDGEITQQPLWSGFQSAGVHHLGESTTLVLRAGDTGTTITADVVVLQEVTASRDGPRQLPRLRAPVSPRENVERFDPQLARYVRFTTLATIDENRHEPCIDELEIYGADSRVNIALAASGTQASSSGDLANSRRHRLKHINDGRYGNARSWISDEKGAGWVQLELPAAVMIERIVWGRDREGEYDDRLPVRYRIDVSVDAAQWNRVSDDSDRVPFGTPHEDLPYRLRNAPDDAVDDLVAMAGELHRLQAERDRLLEVPQVYGGVFGQADQAQLLARGDPEQPLVPVSPQLPVLFDSQPLPETSSDQQRRQALAEWLASPTNPLTARVMANRIWQYHFGRGLVETASDFGLNGTAPSHPELLDWLARELIECGWSLKHLHRLILTSDVYRRSSAIRSAAVGIDSDDRLLWRFPSRRLEAEAIRDGMLGVSGELNLAMGGPGFDLFQSRGGLSGFPPLEQFEADHLRRMIYAHKVRMEPAPVFGVFDCPDAGQPMPLRSRSTTAIQALNLFNSAFVIERAEHFADGVLAESGTDVVAQVNAVFRRSLGREPSHRERQAAIPVVEQHGLQTLCRVVFNSNEFLFIP